MGMAMYKTIKTDIVVKNYWRDNARFANLFNAVLFEGGQVILPEDLKDIDTEGSFVLEHKNLVEGIQAARDNIKICKHSTRHGATCLHEMLTVDEELAPFINDYKMLLVEARKNNRKLHHMENIDLFNLLSIFLNDEKRMEKANEYVKEHEVAGEVLMTIAGVTGRKRICDVSGKKGEDAMCTI